MPDLMVCCREKNTLIQTYVVQRSTLAPSGGNHRHATNDYKLYILLSFRILCRAQDFYFLYRGSKEVHLCIARYIMSLGVYGKGVPLGMVMAAVRGCHPANACQMIIHKMHEKKGQKMFYSKFNDRI